MSRLYKLSRLATVITMLLLALFIHPVVLLLLPVTLWINERAIKTYEQYDSLAWYQGLAQDEKDALDWFVEP